MLGFSSHLCTCFRYAFVFDIIQFIVVESITSYILAKKIFSKVFPFVICFEFCTDMNSTDIRAIFKYESNLEIMLQKLQAMYIYFIVIFPNKMNHMETHGTSFLPTNCHLFKHLELFLQAKQYKHEENLNNATSEVIDSKD